MHLNYSVKARDFTSAGSVSSAIKKVLKQLNIPPADIKRIIVALYEAEVNIVAHSYGGTIECELSHDRIELTISDEGPGISDLTMAMTEGYSTATEEVREMGFGAGMGLSNIKKNSDVLAIDTAADSPTIIHMTFNLKQGG
ncbi:MAG: ATP-binding protein [Sphaerochaetaceae bacterium]|nr:ATP-binding protein [Sphaerochaetaceae bacterium]MDC7247831.1 ATP-binding protein [Sphaerochaetaceae bacterium]